jgi:L-lysine exporter family protein LysE/ArgO
MAAAFITGMGTSAGLIIAIGAQNAYLLTQSVRGNHYMVIAALCMFFDVLLISVGVAGVGAYVSTSPLLLKIAAYGGAAFLFAYGAMSLKSAFKSNTMTLAETTDDSLKKVVFTTLAVTLLNPHVYLDTIVLMGGISAQYQDSSRIMFGAGACLASILWFYILAVAGVKLATIFSKPFTWRVLDITMCTVMWTIAASLVI